MLSILSMAAAPSCHYNVRRTLLYTEETNSNVERNQEARYYKVRYICERLPNWVIIMWVLPSSYVGVSEEAAFGKTPC